MINCDELPLFPLQVVLYPEMPLPLHIFEPRYREMVRRCRQANSPFGVIFGGADSDSTALPHAIGTTARVTHCEELPDGCMNILVTGETRFRVLEVQQRHAYLTARVQPFAECEGEFAWDQPTLDTASELFKDYVRALFARTGRTLSTLQLPQEPQHLSYAIATFLPIPLGEKQQLLEISGTERRLAREIEILGRELEVQASLQEIVGDEKRGPDVPVRAQALSHLASRN